MFKTVLDRAPLIAFAVACLLIAFGFGYRTASKQSYPFQLIDGVLKTNQVIVSHYTNKYSPEFYGFTDIPVAKVASQRVTVVAKGANENFLLSGGPQQYLEFCPVTGCLAVILDRSGKLIHAYPFRPNAFRKGDVLDLPYQQPFMAPETDLDPFGLDQLPNGDLIVTFYNDRAFPFGAGVARSL